MPQEKPLSPLGMLLSGWKTSRTDGGFLLKLQIDKWKELMAQQHQKNKGRNIPISYKLSHSLCLSQSTRNRLHKHKGCENERMGLWEEDVTAELLKLGRLRICSLWMHLKDLNRTESSQPRERKRQPEKNSAVTRKEKKRGRTRKICKI